MNINESIISFNLINKFLDNHYYYQKIYKERAICNVKVIDEQRDYIGGKPQTYKYKLEFNYNGEIYIKDSPHMYEYGHFKKGQNVQIICQKSNPYNFIIYENSNYWNLLLVSILFFTLSYIRFKYSEKISNLLTL